MASRFWVGGGSSTNWSATANTNWSATSGGANNASVPTTTDDVIFDASSGAGASVIDTGFTVLTVDCTGFTGTLTHNAGNLTISALKFKLAPGMTFSAPSGSRTVIFTTTSGTALLTSGGKTLGSVTVNGAGGTVQLQDNLTFLGSGTLTLTNGTFDANNNNVTGGAFSGNNSNTRVLTMGSGTWTFNNINGSVWDTGTITGLTVNPNTASLVFSGSSTPTGSRTFATGGLTTFPAVSIVGGTSSYAFTMTGAPTLASLSVTSPLTLRLPSSTTTTVTAPYTTGGSSSSSVFFLESSDATGGGVATLSVTNAGAATLTWAAIQNITFSGSATFSATNSFDLKGNTGGNITGPSGGGGASVIGS